MVLVALVASARTAEGLVPVGRTMASEAAAIRLLSDAIVRAVRDLSPDRPDRPDMAPGQTQVDSLGGPVAQLVPPDGANEPGSPPRLGWHLLDRPPPLR